MQSVRNNRFVATEVNYPAPNTGVQRARSAEFGGSWESFAFEWDEATQTYALRARSTSVGGWERFVLFYFLYDIGA
ncbi:hypothetical protein ACFWR9_34235 [Streptomyces sp. NPDC058534]|uniref:hypothetical protein n=1 Tax=Streptomyces sp. NPDC058534 TaxID=3346541 RepID=UPI00364B25B6